MQKLFPIIALLLLGCGKDTPTAMPKGYAVRFEVRGFVSRVDIDYSDGKTALQTYNLDGNNLPWTFSFSGSSRANVSIRARIRTGYLSGGQDISFVSVQIHLDGELWKLSPLAQGQGAAAEISVALP
jgi:hypothetical protein